MIIGLMGQKGSGKTTVAKFIEDMYEAERLAYADPLKKVCKEVFVLSDNQLYNQEFKGVVDHRWGITPRQMFQMVGTDMFRKWNSDVWIKNINIRLDNLDSAVVEDCRFANEARNIKAQRGLVIGIKRDLGQSEDLHASEVDMLDEWDAVTDVTVNNDGTLEELYLKVEEIVDEYIRTT
jgi:hypothetical protein